MDPKQIFIHKDIVGSFGTREATEVRLSTCVKDGETEIIISHKIMHRLPLNRENWQKVHDAYEKLTRADGGRLCLEIDHLIELLGRLPVFKEYLPQ